MQRTVSHPREDTVRHAFRAGPGGASQNATTMTRKNHPLKKLCLALLFLLGGASHEVRNPVGCHCIAVKQDVRPKRRHD